MTQRNDGGPAFPFAPVPGTGSLPNSGMTLRDHFAGEALRGMMTRTTHRDDRLPDEIANDCYRIADAMIAERQK